MPVDIKEKNVYVEPAIELEWLIHYKCNYRCPYCFFADHWDEVSERNVDLPLADWILAWERLRKKYGHVRILITGGEPFIYPRFVEIMHNLSQDFSIGFDTNLSCSKELLVDFVSKTERSNISIGLSFHPKFAEYESFLEKALFLKEEGYQICVQYVSYPEQIQLMPQYRDKFKDSGLYFIPLPFRGSYKGLDYPASFNQEERKLIYNSTDNLDSEHKERVEKQLNQVKVKMKMCRAGQDYARIDADGTVFRCGHSVSSPENKPMGNFFDKDFKFLESPLCCEQDVCPCEFRWLVK